MAPRLSDDRPTILAKVSLLLLLCGPAAAPLFGAPSQATRSAEAPKSVVFIVVDTLRADHLGCYGYPRPTSPHIDALATRGVLFKNTLSQSSWTLPSMISLMMGRYVLGLTPLLPGNIETMAELFSARGYETAAFVANGVVSGPAGFTRGFDLFRSEDNLLELPEHTRESSVFKLGEIVNDEVQYWAEKRAATEKQDPDGAPFFIYIHYMDPHRPYLPLGESAPFAESYEPLGPLAKKRYDDFVAEHPDLQADAEAQLQRIRDTIQRYDADVSYTDARIGEMLASLEDLGLMDNTVVALVADHGEGLFDRREYDELVRQQGPPEAQRLADYFKNGHGRQLNSELVSTPIIFAGPGVVAGRMVIETVANVSVLPTLVELATGDIIDDRDGQNLVPALVDETFSLDQRSMLYSWCIQATAVLHPKRRLKLLRPNDAGLQYDLVPTLFDLLNDPGEDRNALDSDASQMAAAARFLNGVLVEREKLSLNQSKSTEYLEATRRKMLELGYIR